jgi:hypothetical protein
MTLAFVVRGFVRFWPILLKKTSVATQRDQ